MVEIDSPRRSLPLEATLALATIVRAVRVTSEHDDFPVETPFTVVAAEPIPARISRRRTS
ncbi:hypothetical protein ACWDTP_16720 [Mycobacterium sp. NPDC003449]